MSRLRVLRIARIGSVGWLVAAGASGAAEPCVESPTQVCAAGGRFRLSATFTQSGAPAAPIAAGGTLLPPGPPTQSAAIFWFGDPGTIDLRVGIVERCAPTTSSAGVDVSVAATTQNAFQVRVEDLATASHRTLTRKAGAARGSLRADAAFPCLEAAN